MTSLKSLY